MNPNGSTWLYADTNKYRKSYEEFPTTRIHIGQSRSELLSVLGPSAKVTQASARFETIILEQWKSVPGPDYVENTLHVQVSNQKVAGWRITKDTVEIVPRTF